MILEHCHITGTNPCSLLEHAPPGAGGYHARRLINAAACTLKAATSLRSDEEWQVVRKDGELTLLSHHDRDTTIYRCACARSHWQCLAAGSPYSALNL